MSETRARSPAAVPASPALATVRLAGYMAWTLVCLPVQIVSVVLHLPFARRFPVFYHRICCRILGMRLEVSGRPSRQRPTLFVANHVSYLDIMVYGALIPGSFVAKAEVAGWPLFGLLAKLQRSVFIDRKMAATKAMAETIRRRLDRRDALILFPEGTSGDGNSVLPFRSSLFAAAAEYAGAGRALTVQPVTIAYTHLDGIPLGRLLRPFFAWYGDMDMASHMWQFVGLGRTSVSIIFHEAFDASAEPDRKALARRCFEAVAEGYADALAGQLPAARRRRRIFGFARRPKRLRRASP